MRGLNASETKLVVGGSSDYPELPPPGVSQWEWDQLLRLIEEQNKRNGQQQH